MMFTRECEWAIHRETQRETARRNRIEKIKKVQALLDDPASTDGEKNTARIALARLKAQQII